MSPRIGNDEEFVEVKPGKTHTKIHIRLSPATVVIVILLLSIILYLCLAVAIGGTHAYTSMG